jgi:hypothetical protein
MHHYIVAISGFSGVGKDEFAKRLVSAYKAVQTGLADPMKRHMADVYGFSAEQLFGPSSMRNSGDLRYPKKLFYEYNLQPVDGPIPSSANGVVIPGKKYWQCEGRFTDGVQEISSANPDKPAWFAAPYVQTNRSSGPLRLSQFRYYIIEGHPSFWLSPREALQKYGELMNNLYGDTWIRLGIEIQKKLAIVRRHDGDGIEFEYEYNKMDGIFQRELVSISGQPLHYGDLITCFSDFRHWNEIRYARQSGDELTTVVLVRVKHPQITTPPYQHRSETEQATIPDSEFDFVVMNDGTIEDLYAKADKIIAQMKK